LLQSLQSKFTFAKTLCLKRRRKESYVGASAGMAAACGERILGIHGRKSMVQNELMQIDHAGLSMSWFWGQVVSWQTAIQQNGITKL